MTGNHPKLLKLKSAERDERIVKALKDALEEAEAGKLVSVIVVKEYPDSYGWEGAGEAGLAKHLGALDIVKYRWLERSCRDE